MMTTTIEDLDPRIKQITDKVNRQVRDVVSRFEKIQESHEENTRVLKFEFGEMVRRTEKNNRRRINFNEGSDAIGRVGLAAVLVVGGAILVASTNRWRREVQYMKKMFASAKNVSAILTKEAELFDAFNDLIKSVEELQYAVNQLPSLYVQRRNLRWIQINCPLFTNYIITEVAPSALGDIAANFIFEHPETSAHVPMTVLAPTVEIALSMGQEAITSLFLDGAQVVAGIEVVIHLFPPRNARKEVKEASEQVEAYRDVMNKRENKFEALMIWLSVLNCMP
jgi:hypothetical protein